MADKPPTALDEACATVVVGAIGAGGTMLDRLRCQGLSYAALLNWAVGVLAAAGKPTPLPDREILSALERGGAKPGQALMVAEGDVVRLLQGLKGFSPRMLRVVCDLIKTCAEDIAEVEPSA